MREPQKTILEKTKPIFPAVTQPIISAASHPERSGVTYTRRFRKAAGMPRVIDQEKRRLSHAHKVRFSDDEELAFQDFMADNGISAQYALRGLFLVKASIENDGLAAKVRNMRARHHRRH